MMELERALADIRLSPEPMDERTEELKQQYETVLTLLESEFLGALMSADWSEFDRFVNDFKYDERCGFAVDFQRHTQIRDRLRATLEALKAEGITRSELIECLGNETHLLLIEDEKQFKANADSLSRSGAGSSQTTAVNERKD